MKTCSNCGHKDGKPYERPCGDCKVGNPPSMWVPKVVEIDQFKTDEKYYIVRCDRVGVFAGNIKERGRPEKAIIPEFAKARDNDG